MAKRSTDENLKPIRSVDEARRKGKKGGKASGESRREKKLLRECLEILLEKQTVDVAGKECSGAEAVATAMFLKACAGDTKAFELVRDTVGQKPVDKIVTTEVDPAVIDAIEKMVNDDTESSC